jgi:glucose/arabinose dehydrogenase
MSANLLLLLASVGAADESTYYTVDHLVAPPGCIAEVGGMDFLPDRRLVVSTRRGQVWIVENALAPDPAAAKFTLFAEGLREGLGLTVVDGVIYVMQRQEISRLVDTDDDGRCDRIETVCDTWGLSTNYHEFGFGLPRDRDGNFYISLNVGFGSPLWWHGVSYEPWRGWVCQIAPDGTLTPFASGFRSPCGIALNAAGDLFVTDNQGDWVPTSSIAHVEQGHFYGAPASLKWTAAYRETNTEPSLTNPVATPRTPPAIWIPYGWSRSTGDVAPFPAGGAFLPFGPDQLAVAEMTNGDVLRADLEKVNGKYQGAILPFRKGVGSAIRTKFAPDGTLMLGLTNRGWGGRPPGYGIARVRTTGRIPFEIAHVTLIDDGFCIAFTEPLVIHTRIAAADVLLRRHHYDWWWEYGSPERDRRVLPVDSVEIAADRRSISLHASQLECGEVATVILPELMSQGGEPLLHREFAYTINEMRGAPCTQPIARVAPPPPARESSDQGWLRLCYGDAFQMWQGEGWKLVDVDLDAADPTKLALREGVNALVNSTGSAFTCRLPFGDMWLRFDFLLPKDGRALLRLMDRYDLLLSATPDERATTLASCGALMSGPGFPGVAPQNPCFRAPGDWHSMDLTFRAPCFDAAGKKVANARIVRAMVDDVLLHDEVEFPAPSAGAPRDEVAEAPFSFRVLSGQVALNDIRAKPTEPDALGDGWQMLAEDEDLAAWNATSVLPNTPEAFKAELADDELTIGGTRGVLATKREDFGDVEIAFRMKVSAGGTVRFWPRFAPSAPGSVPKSQPKLDAAGPAPDFLSFEHAGYAIALNADAPGPGFMGSLDLVNTGAGASGSVRHKVQLVAPETWCWVRARVAEDADGTRVIVWLNGVEVASVLDRSSTRPRRGSFAIQQVNDGSRAVFENVRWRPAK